MFRKVKIHVHVPKKIRIGMQSLFHITGSCANSCKMQSTTQIIHTALVSGQIRSNSIDLSGGCFWSFVQE